MGSNYVLSWHESVKNTAGSKAKDDVTEFLKEDGFNVIDTPYGKIQKILYVFFVLPFIFLKIRKGNIVIQYPTGKPKILKAVIFGAKKLSGAKLIFVIHDIYSLRFLGDDPTKSKEELELLNKADYIVSHNEHMTAWLKNNGVSAKIVNLEIFDYLNNTNPVQPEQDYMGLICLAGNLKKSYFLDQFKPKNPLYIFGPNPKASYNDNINYMGVYPPEELANHLTYNFGLVWEGNSTNTCNGVLGEYTKYNNPHKVSLYLSTGLPVIIWKQAALADFVTKNNVGIAIESLDEIDDAIKNVSKQQYAQMKSNTDIIAKKMRSGFYIKSAIHKLID